MDDVPVDLGNDDPEHHPLIPPHADKEAISALVQALRKYVEEGRRNRAQILPEHQAAIELIHILIEQGALLLAHDGRSHYLAHEQSRAPKEGYHV